MFSHTVGREGRCKQITLACARSVSATLGLALLMARAPSLPTQRAVCSAGNHPRLVCSAGNHPRLALGCLHLPGLSRSGSGTQVVLRGTDSVGSAFCALPRSEPLRWTRCLASTVAVTYRLPCPCRSVFWVYNGRTFSGGCQPSRIPRCLG